MPTGSRMENSTASVIDDRVSRRTVCHTDSIEEPVSLRVLAVRGNNPPSLAVVDLSEGDTTIYEMGVHPLSADPVDGAVADS